MYFNFKDKISVLQKLTYLDSLAMTKAPLTL